MGHSHAHLPGHLRPGGDALIRHNVTGWKCDVSDVSSTVTDLAMLINSPKMRLRLGAGAEKALESHNMDWPFVIGMMEDYYDVLLKPIAGAGANGMVAMQSRHEVMEIVARRKASDHQSAFVCAQCPQTQLVLIF